jgi:hypothetical protein
MASDAGWKYWSPKPLFSLSERLEVVIRAIEQEIQEAPGFKFRCFLLEEHRHFLPPPFEEKFKATTQATDEFLARPLEEHDRVAEVFRARVVREWSAQLEGLRLALNAETE